MRTFLFFSIVLKTVNMLIALFFIQKYELKPLPISDKLPYSLFLGAFQNQSVDSLSNKLADFFVVTILSTLFWGAY